ncbi:MAG: hypothetical protein HFG72_08545 [Hungatella sp.]|nr:hypothetical protein [Hungatella sp.]
MTGRIIGFIIWQAVGLFFVGNGLWCFKAKKPSGFWANARTAPIEDVRAYNKAMGSLWCVYGIVLMILGVPFLLENGLWIMLSCVGVMVETIGVMAVYTLVIEKKYRKE